MSDGGNAEGIAARRAALSALADVEERGAYANLAVPAAVADLPNSRDRALASHLAYDTLRWQGTLDWALQTVVSRPLADVEPALRRVLRLGALQLLRTDVPARAVVHTSANLAKQSVPKNRANGAGGFVNGVLRALDRQQDSLPWPDPDKQRIASLGLRTAHPEWIVEEAVKVFGPAAEAALSADNEPPGTTLRAVGDRDALIAELLGDGVEAVPTSLAAEGVHAPGLDVARSAAVAQGRAVVQDEASMLVVHATEVKTGDRVLDLCGGPGGKTTHLASLAGPSGTVTAVELHPHRAKLITETADRLGATVDVRVGDGRASGLQPGAYDVVLVDAPCSDLGTGRRRPDIRWRRSPDEVASVARLQRELLEAGALLVAPGGTLTYSVCTWTGRETMDTIAAAGPIGDGWQLVANPRQYMPHTDGTDGMFVAVWRRAT